MSALTVVVLGASPNPQRFSNQAVRLLKEHGHDVIPVNPAAGRIEGVDAVKDLPSIRAAVDTLSVYVGPQRSAPLIPQILALKPRRVVLNPGTESDALEQALRAAGIVVLRDCTLRMLREGRF
jgi:hypothetical protein